MYVNEGDSCVIRSSERLLANISSNEVYASAIWYAS